MVKKERNERPNTAGGEPGARGAAAMDPPLLYIKVEFPLRFPYRLLL